MTKNVICFGEVLWDVLPYERVAGGAPLNVAIRLQSLGIQASIISRIGIDEPGTELLSIIGSKGVDTSLLQQDLHFTTGEVAVQLDAHGIAIYEILYPAAWDKIETTEQNMQAVKNCDAFVFGSLACRDEVSRNTLLQLLELATYKVFDVNIRPPFYKIKFLEQLMKKADFIKLNQEELLEIAGAMGSSSTEITENILFLSSKTGTSTVCVTRGKDGALLFINNQFYSNKGYPVKVADTVGPGDSFLAALLARLLYSNDYIAALAFACAVGALVASHKGANPTLSQREIELLLK